MANFASNTFSGFRGLLDTVAADNVGSNPLIGGDGVPPDRSVLGPSVGDDVGPAPNLAVVGPRVGDGLAKSVLTVLGPCVGDD
jgi:hypothetical protein